MTKESNNPIYTISNAAKLLNISVHTIRMYEREGLLIPFKKASGQRLYSDMDIKRIECIRHAINKENLNIHGIKRVLSLIPCWSITGCPETARINCRAYNSSSLPCWVYNNTKSFCKEINCRDCEVYQKQETCESIKNKLKELLK